MIPNYNNMDFNEQDLNSVGDLDQLATLLGREQEQIPQQAGFGDLMARLASLGGDEQPAQYEPDLGDPRTLSRRVQEFTTAKKPYEQGMTGQILSNRFQQEDQGPAWGDIAQGAAQTFFGGGKPVSGQDVVNARSLQQAQAARAMGGGGGNSVYAQRMAELNNNPETAGLPIGMKMQIASGKLGTNLTYDANGTVVDMMGAAQGLGNLQYGKTLGGENAKIETAAEIERQKMLGGPLPNQVVQSQDELIDAMQTHKYLSGQMDKFIGQIDSGQLNLNVIGNIVNKQKNNLSLSTEESRNLASFQATLERLRNESLRLNKGVQTEGDSIRAWNELVANINDPLVVKQRLSEIKEYNNIAKDLKFERLKLMRGEFGRETPSTIIGPQSQGSKPAMTQTYDQISPADADVESLINQYAD